MKKLLSLLLIVTMLGVSMTACSSDDVTIEEDSNNEEIQNEEAGEEESEKDPIDVSVIAPTGTPALTMVKMIEEEPTIADYATVNYELIEATDVLTARLVSGEADIAIVPTNLAVNLHNQDLEFKLAGSSVWGVLYLVSSEEISSIEDVKGKTMSLIGRGLTPDATIRYLLTENGIVPDEDVTFEYFSGSSELASNYIAGQSDLALIPQPVLTNVLQKRDDSKVVIDIQELWSETTGLDKYPQASLIISEDLIENHPDFVEAFIEEYAESVAWINENPAEAGVYYENLNIGLNATIVEKAIPECNMNFVPAEEAMDELNTYLNVLFEFNPNLLGGSTVNEDLYLR